MSRRALSLSAYLTFARGENAPAGTAPPLPKRGRGALVLAQADTAEHGRALATLCARLLQQRPEVQVILTGHDAAEAASTWGMQSAALPPERANACDTFASHLRPDCLLWTGQDRLRPALLNALHQGGTHLIALDAQDRPWSAPSPRWLPDPAPAALALFDTIHAVNPAAGRRLRRLGVAPEQLRVSGPLEEASLPLECLDAPRDELSEMIGGRPVWLAAHLRASEVHDVLRAHRRAVRMAHRLLLIIVPHDGAEAPAIARAVEAEQMRAANWDAGEVPDDNTQVLMAEGPEELGLWYRLAPLAFLGGSLVSGSGGQNPMEAALLGTAVLYGPNVGQHLDAYTRLVDAGAARIVRDADSLASAVSNLIAPDAAAAMAHAGWDVASSSAELIDGVITDICALLDARGAA